MAEGDIIFSRAVDGECEIPCCYCNFPDELTVDFSGIVACICTGSGDAVAEARNTIMPTEWTVTKVLPNTWTSEISGSFDYYIGPDCENLEFNTTYNLPFSVTVTCATSGEFAGKFGIVMNINGPGSTQPAFSGTADGIDEPADNTVLCNSVIGMGLLGLYFSGTATISIPPP